MEQWRNTWRNGFVPAFQELLGGNTYKALVALQEACLTDDPRLIQGSTSDPTPVVSVFDWPVTGACAAGYCGWMGEAGCESVENVLHWFGRVCYAADKHLGEPAGVRHFLKWFDETPRLEMLGELAAELQLNMEYVCGLPYPVGQPERMAITLSACLTMGTGSGRITPLPVPF